MGPKLGLSVLGLLILFQPAAGREAPAATAKQASQVPATVSRTVSVTVADSYYAPSKLTIRRGTLLRWIWSPRNHKFHDVHLLSGPRGLSARGSYSTRKRFVRNAVFKKAFSTLGRYEFFCSVHPRKMRLSLTVSKESLSAQSDRANLIASSWPR
jgi:plastocyanin